MNLCYAPGKKDFDYKKKELNRPKLGISICLTQIKVINNSLKN
jgi:hypothetical protein